MTTPAVPTPAAFAWRFAADHAAAPKIADITTPAPIVIGQRVWCGGCRTHLLGNTDYIERSICPSCQDDRDRKENTHG